MKTEDKSGQGGAEQGRVKGAGVGFAAFGSGWDAL